MLSKQDREQLYKKAAGNCGVDIYSSTPAFFYGTFVKTLVTNPAKYGLPSQLGINRTSYKTWKYRTVVMECCDYFFGLAMHPKCSVALRWPNFKDHTRVGLLAAGYSMHKIFRAYDADVKLTNSEFIGLLDAVHIGKISEEKLTYNHAWFLVWKHIPNVLTYYHPRSRKVIDYLVRHKEYFIDNCRRIDEIFDDDITDIKLKPEHLFQRKEEIRRIEEEKRNPLVTFPPFPYTLIDGIEYIDNSKKLTAEGNRMHHCVAGYKAACIRGDTFILKLPKSTVEINTSGNVNQHRAEYNRTPPVEDIDLLRKWKHERRRIGEQTALEALKEQKLANYV